VPARISAYLEGHMSRLAAISVKNYRCFADLASLELRPLTLLYGWNNSGKSALLRLLPLIADSVAPRTSGPLELRGGSGAGREGSIGDIFWKGAPDPNDEDPSLRILLEFSDAPLSKIEYRIDLDRQSRRTFIKSLSVLDGERGVPVSASSFAGLLPINYMPDAPFVGQIHQQMAELHGMVQWLGAVRTIKRDYAEPGSEPRLLSCAGTDAPDVLFLRPDLLDAVSDWYRTSCDKVLKFAVSNRSYRILLRPDHLPGMDVDLFDSGEGMIQVLPVLTAVEMARSGMGPRIVAVEEAESHLHPKAQRTLAERLCQVASGMNPPVLVLETHSHVFMLGVQLQIAMGKIKPSQVVAYWVEQEHDGRSAPRRVTFNERGDAEKVWMRETFAEHRELARELLKIQQEQARGPK
jgi:predicted ATPase